MNKQEAKADAGKVEIDLVPTQIIRDIAEVRMYGNAKYGDPDNWKTVELRRYVNALLRHTLAFMDDHEGKDEESGIPHYKHMACNLAFICELMKGAAGASPRPTEKDINDAIFSYCEGVDCGDCVIKRICDSAYGNWLNHPEECKMAYNIIKEETK